MKHLCLHHLVFSSILFAWNFSTTSSQTLARPPQSHDVNDSLSLSSLMDGMIDVSGIVTSARMIMTEQKQVLHQN
jgi:hypothetical protein